jgi:pimeloyl-ACP methyl ester carboxylesterase
MNIIRTRFKKDIVAEVAFPTRLKKRGNDIVILASGFPSMPGKGSVLEFFARRGYIAVLPRYRGTWESDGVFLKDSPERDIIDVIDEIEKGSVLDLWSEEKNNFVPQKIVLIGSSFGGAAVLLASRDVRVGSVVTLSPVVDWSAKNKTEPLDWMYGFVRRGFGSAFYFTKGGWNKLAGGIFFNPMHYADEIDGKKILIFHTKDDDAVSLTSVKKFAGETKSKLIVYKRGGHLSLRHVTRSSFDKRIKQFLAR